MNKVKILGAIIIIFTSVIYVFQEDCYFKLTEKRISISRRVKNVRRNTFSLVQDFLGTIPDSPEYQQLREVIRLQLELLSSPDTSSESSIINQFFQIYGLMSTGFYPDSQTHIRLSAIRDMAILLLDTTSDKIKREAGFNLVSQLLKEYLPYIGNFAALDENRRRLWSALKTSLMQEATLSEFSRQPGESTIVDLLVFMKFIEKGDRENAQRMYSIFKEKAWIFSEEAKEAREFIEAIKTNLRVSSIYDIPFEPLLEIMRGNADWKKKVVAAFVVYSKILKVFQETYP